VPAFKYNPQQAFHHILVPSIDTTRFGFLLEASICVRHPMLVTGKFAHFASALEVSLAISVGLLGLSRHDQSHMGHLVSR
jgi:P-loop containing dynein motor region